MNNSLSRLRSIQGSSDISISTFPTKPYIFRRAKKLFRRKEAWNETYRLTFEHLHNVCLAFTDSYPPGTTDDDIMETGIYKGVHWKLAKFLSILFRSDWIRLNYSDSLVDPKLQQLIYDMIVFPHPGGLCFTFENSEDITIRYPGSHDSFEQTMDEDEEVEVSDENEAQKEEIEKLIRDSMRTWKFDNTDNTDNTDRKDYNPLLMEWMYTMIIGKAPEQECPFFVKEAQRIFLS